MTVVVGLSENVPVVSLRAIVEEGPERYAFLLEKEAAYVRVEEKNSSFRDGVGKPARTAPSTSKPMREAFTPGFPPAAGPGPARR